MPVIGVERVRIPSLAPSVINKHEVLQKCYTSKRHELGSIIYVPLAQLAEHYTFNVGSLSSNLRWDTNNMEM